MHLNIRPLVSLFAVTALSACASVSPAGLIAAARLDPLNTPPNQIAVAVGVPQQFRLRSGDARLRISFKGGTAAATVQVQEAVPLQFARSGGARRDAPVGNAGETVYVAHLAAEDAAAFARAQAEIRALRQKGVPGSGSLNVEIVGGCHVGALPAKLPVSSWLETNAGDGFVALTRQVDLFASLDSKTASTLRARLHPC